MYQYIQTELKCPNVIDECLDYKADENHKWGLAPMHYQKEYYEEIVELVKDIIK